MHIKHLVLAVLLASSAIAAHSEGNSFRICYSDITLHSQSPNLTSNGPAFLTPQPAGVTVGDSKTATFGYTRRLNDSWDLDLLIGVPPTHAIHGTGTLAPFGETAMVTQASPTAFLNYQLAAPGSILRPYVGLGLNFTHFYKARSTDSGNLATGGPTKISLSNSVGLAAQVGASYQISPAWAWSASLATAKVETDMLTQTGSIERKTTVDLRPVVLSVGLVYGF